MENKQKVKKPKTVGGIIGTVLFYILMAILAVIVVFLILGYRPAIVLSGSMRPAIQPGDVTVYHSANIEDLAINDIIMYNNQGNAADGQSTGANVTHRIKEIQIYVDGTLSQILTENGQKAKDLELGENVTIKVRTKGDANNSMDSPITQSQIVGKVAFWIPWIGIPLNFVRNHLVIVVGAIICIIIISYIISILRKGKDETTGEQKNEIKDEKKDENNS